MKLYKIDNRELRSFKLRHKVLNLRTFFDDQNSFGLFMMNDSLQPNKWISKRKEYNDNNLKFETITKKTANYLTPNKDWETIKLLLNGNVNLIKPKDTKALTLTPKQITFLITQEKYSLRFGYWKQTLFRTGDLNRVLTFSDLNNNNIMNLMLLLKKIVIMRTLILPTLLIKNK